ncbi:hypothetical protein BDK51DRAFT_26517 [Blyttiomyces helicus]|uniref:Uncharacterized protein n=1 Tax=Blyttiomyces helicus TaxID=388810 RepID=A0A4P9W5H6_9FUNG|nr:hypothetical protein BDK51DRAFT_26517 [Blyttiomyces helicus]|eukprot:RKO87661.1 hypothetical protein BDK51DRAFT_26517 [Blyttiomyces helicus]
MSKFLEFVSTDNMFLADLQYSFLPSEEVLHFMVKTAFPALSSCEYALSIKDEDGKWVHYSPLNCCTTLKFKFHDVRDVSSLVSNSKSLPRPSKGLPCPSHDLTTSQAVSSDVSSMLEEDICWRKEYLRWTCMRRDQVCTITGVCDEEDLKCCHGLTPDYAKDWFPGVLCRLPSIYRQTWNGCYIKNAFVLTTTLPDLFNSFAFSIWRDGDKLTVYAF